MPASGALPHWCCQRVAQRYRRSCRQRPRSKSGRRNALLHGCGVAGTEGSRSRARGRARTRREGRRSRDVLHARHVEERPSRSAQESGPRLLQSQPGYRTRILWTDRIDACVPGSVGYAVARSRRRHCRVLRRHRRHGRITPPTGRPDRAARQSGSLSGIGADQSSRSSRGYAAARSFSRRKYARRVRVRPDDRRCANHDAESHGAIVGGAARIFRRGSSAVFSRRRQFDLLR